MTPASIIYLATNAASAALCVYLAATMPLPWAMVYAVFAAGNAYYVVRRERAAQ